MAPQAIAAPATFEEQMLVLINQLRATGATCGKRRMRRVSALVGDPQLAMLAERFSVELLQTQHFSHNDLQGRTPIQRAEEAGGDGFLGEALARNARSASSAVRSLMASESHCRLLMHEDARRAGVAFSEYRGAVYASYLVIEVGR